jgi:hypothetical protein
MSTAYSETDRQHYEDLVKSYTTVRKDAKRTAGLWGAIIGYSTISTVSAAVVAGIVAGLATRITSKG